MNNISNTETAGTDMASSGPQPADPRATFGRAIATTASAIAGVRPEQLDDPTPCDEMDVRGMLAHLVGVLDRITALGQGEDSFAVTERIVADDRWGDAWATSAQRAVAAWSDDAVLERPIALPWVQGPGGEVLATYFSELTVHTWDLATATGQQPDWDDEVVAAALDSTPFLPAENRRELFEAISAQMGLDEVALPFAEVVPVPDDAPGIDRLVAWNGRDPSR